MDSPSQTSGGPCKTALPPVISDNEQSSFNFSSSPTDRPSESEDPKPRPASAKVSFKGAGQAIKLSLKATNGFATLRDRGGVEVPPRALKVIRKLGEGAFAVVEEADYKSRSCDGVDTVSSGLSRRVAVKRLKPEIVNHEGDLESFVKEISLLRKLSHKRVVEFIGVGSLDCSSEKARRRTMFLVQEFMDGGTLKRMLGKQMMDVGRQLYSYVDAFRWSLHIAEGLEYLHNVQPTVIHRDLKLENILLKGADPHTAEAKIADFGLVALVRPRNRVNFQTLKDSDEAQLSLSMSRSKSFFRRALSVRKKVQTIQELWDESFRIAQTSTARSLPPQQLSGRTGSYMYMAPEMYKGEDYNEKVDVFSYGVIIFEIFARYQTVCAVSVAGTQEEIESYAQKVSQGYRPPLPALWPECVRELIAQCWHQDPDQRPSMWYVRQRLAEMQREGIPNEMQANLLPPACSCAIM